MQIRIPPEMRRAQEIFEAEWKRRHPATPAPSPALYEALTPEQRQDPLWREAEELRRESALKAHAETLPQPSDGPRWSAFPLWVVCPNNHFVSPEAKFCPQCGLPVPRVVAEDARALTSRANERALLGLWMSERY